MSDETLLSAARRLLRFIRIDNEQAGGILSNQTTWAADILAQMIDKATQKEKRDEQSTNGENS